MKRSGELMLNAYEIGELIQAFNEQTKVEVDSLTNDEGEICGACWKQLGCEVSLLVPEKIEKRLDFLEGTNPLTMEEIIDKNTALIEKLFLPWELHLPLYVVVDDGGPDEVNTEESIAVEAWLKSLVRIISEELMSTVGAWIPADKKLAFAVDTWDYDVKLHKHDEVYDADVSDFFSVVGMRALGTSYYSYYI